MVNLLEALTNTEFGDKVTLYGINWVVIKKFPDNTALAVAVGAGFPAPVHVIQLPGDGK